jgi:hypothetical protein
MAKIEPLSDVVNLQSEESARATINDNFSKITDALENTVSRDGSTPNAMESELDMDDHRILNVGDPVAGGDAVNLAYVTELLDGIDTALLGDINDLPTLVADAETAAAQAIAARDLAEDYRDQAAGFIGSATSAAKWTFGRTISITGDAAGTSDPWDGSVNLSFAITLSNGSVTPAKMAAGAAVSNIGYTPVNKAGDSLTGDVRLNYTPTTLYDNSVGYRGVPVDVQDATYTFVMADSGRMKRHTSGTPHTFTVPDNATTPFPIGTILVVRNVGAGPVTIAQGGLTELRLPGLGSTGNRTLNQWGFCTVVKEDTNKWIIQGQGLV